MPFGPDSNHESNGSGGDYQGVYKQANDEYNADRIADLMHSMRNLSRLYTNNTQHMAAVKHYEEYQKNSLRSMTVGFLNKAVP
jgi:hypothetical protein